MKSQKLRIRNLPQENKIRHRVHVKPSAVLVILFLAGLILFFLKPYLLLASITMVSLSVFSIFVMPDKVLCEFTDDYMVLYNEPDGIRCNMIYYEDIVSWKYEWHPAADLLVISLVDGTVQTQELYARRTIARQMKQYAPYKEVRYSGVKRGGK